MSVNNKDLAARIRRLHSLRDGFARELKLTKTFPLPAYSVEMYEHGLRQAWQGVEGAAKALEVAMKQMADMGSSFKGPPSHSTP